MTDNAENLYLDLEAFINEFFMTISENKKTFTITA